MPRAGRTQGKLTQDERSAVALLLIDVINDLCFDGGARLARQALPMARRLARFKQRAKRAGIPAIYVNDNFGQWRSDFRAIVSHCMNEDVRGAPVARLLQPEADDYFVLKPKHSAFYQTSLDTLLRFLGARTLVLTGMSGNLCVLYSAHDAHMRDFELIAPADCIVSERAADNRYALRHLQHELGADITPSSRLRLPRR